MNTTGSDSATPAATQGALAGRTIAIAEGRELEVFAGLLERRGARVLRFPLLRIAPAPDPVPVLRWCREFAAGSCDDLILMTGAGLRQLLACLQMHDAALRPNFLAALAAVRTLTRGPKPARALRELGLAPTLTAAEPTTAGVIATLSALPLRARKVGVQLYGTEQNPALLDFLTQAGAKALPVAPYIYLDHEHTRSVELLQALESGHVDAIAFTSKAQIDRLFAAAAPARVRAALERGAIAVVGPVAAAALAAYGMHPAAAPARQWFLKPLTVELEQLLAAQRSEDPTDPEIQAE